ncbi:MAG: 4-(cytidine 5'-diphospho)-2-C-methyl-D-erythritol kinase [Clostridia bacterium]|nr:4-(cytidine 5'-diphospho)-2-C-methyl-D-erythritol kinase [Clostridia bacterium]
MSEDVTDVRGANTASARAYAKLNLFLDVRNRRSDGYHDLVSVMQRISLCDDVTVTLNGGGISVACDMEELSGPGNLAYLAAERFFGASKAAGGADIYIKKRIPVAGGLGGGSSDAAAVITLLNGLCGLPLDGRALSGLGFSLGADVPFFISGASTALVGGAGERVEAVRGTSGYCTVVAVCGKKRSTGEMYKRLDGITRSRVPEDGILSAVSGNNLEETGKNLYNAFEPLYPENAFAAEIMRESGASGVCLCGSGPCEFALFGSEAAANRTVKRLELNGITAYIAKPV